MPLDLHYDPRLRVIRRTKQIYAIGTAWWRFSSFARSSLNTDAGAGAPLPRRSTWSRAGVGPESVARPGAALQLDLEADRVLVQHHQVGRLYGLTALHRSGLLFAFLSHDMMGARNAPLQARCSDRHRLLSSPTPESTTTSPRRRSGPRCRGALARGRRGRIGWWALAGLLAAGGLYAKLTTALLIATLGL